MSVLFYCIGSLGGAVLCLILFLLIKRVFFSHDPVLKTDRMDEWLKDTFESSNVMVFGKQRRGKDLIFMHVISLIGRKHYSNITYNDLTEVIDLDEINLGDNTIEDCINGTVKRIVPRFEEGGHIYISDGGVFVSNDYDSMLNKKYPTMPMFLALSAQIYGLHVHINSQAVGRPWKKIRDQAECFIQCLQTTRKDDCLYIDIVAYDKLRKAEAESDPIMRGVVRVPISEIRYNTRYFRDVFLDYNPSTRERAFTHVGGINHVA